MSLFNVDKTNDNRKNPQINQIDHDTAPKAHGTTQIHNKTESDTTTGSLSLLERQIVAKQAGTNKAVFGFLDTSNKFGLKVAPDGTDVLTATDDQLIFNSEQNVFKIVASGTISSPALSMGSPGVGAWASTTTFSTVLHGLTYAPAFVAYVTNTTTNVALPFTNFSASGAIANWWELSLQTDETSVYCYLTAMQFGNAATSFAAGFLQVKYYLLQETAK